jgi:hypothetical protein
MHKSISAYNATVIFDSKPFTVEKVPLYPLYIHYGLDFYFIVDVTYLTNDLLLYIKGRVN